MHRMRPSTGARPPHPTVLVAVLSLAAAVGASDVLSACTPRAGPSPDPSPEPLTDRPALDAFVRGVERELEEHRWEAVLSRAEAEHHRTQVVEHGMPEPQYVAELFGLHRVGNSIAPDGSIGWSDLERIESVEVARVRPDGHRFTITGRVTLSDGSSLDLEAWVVEGEEGGYALSGGVG